MQPIQHRPITRSFSAPQPLPAKASAQSTVPEAPPRATSIVLQDRNVQATAFAKYATLRPATDADLGHVPTVAAWRDHHAWAVGPVNLAPLRALRPWNWASVRNFAAWATTPWRHLQGYFKCRVIDMVCLGAGWFVAPRFPYVQVHGLNALLNARGQLKTQGPLVWMLSHTADPWDAGNIARLRNYMPKVPDPMGGHLAKPHAILRPATGLMEKVITGVLGDCFTYVYRRGDYKSEAERQMRNARALQAGAGRALAAGQHTLLFPEGHVSSNGRISVGPVQAARALRQGPQGATPFVPLTLTYESLGKAAPAVMLNIGAPFTIDPSENVCDTDFAVDLSTALGRLNTLTLSGIIGAALLQARSAGQPCRIDDAAVTRWVEALVPAVLQEHASGRKSALHEVAVDEDLIDPSTRRAAVSRAVAQLRRQGLIDADGWFAMDRLTGDAEQTRVFEAELARNRAVMLARYNLQDRFPLAYWGQRLLTQMELMPELRACWATQAQAA